MHHLLLGAALLMLGVPPWLDPGWLPPGLGKKPAKVTICHVDPDGEEPPETKNLPAHAAAKHLAKHPGDYEGECLPPEVEE